MKAVLFDLDGLMFDTNQVFALAWDYAGEKMGIGKAGYMTGKTLGRSISMSRDVWLAEFGDVFDEAALRQYTAEFLHIYYQNHQAPVKKGLHHLLDYLKSHHIPIGVVSSSPRWEVERHLNGAGIRSYFDVAVCGDDVTHTKPDPELYQLACANLHLVPSDCMALEDSKSGILSAHRAGCTVLMVPDLWPPNNEVNHMVCQVCKDLDMVLNVFEKEFGE